MKEPQHCFNSGHRGPSGGVIPATPQDVMSSAIRPLPESAGALRRDAAGSHTLAVATPLVAMEEICRMRGGSQSHLMRCSDGSYYVVKFQNNPQHRRILVNEMLGTGLAGLLGLPTTASAIVDVREELIKLTPSLHMEAQWSNVPCQHGLQFGSRYPGDPRELTLFDFLPNNQLLCACNLSDFLGMLVFDLWTCNTDPRQVIFGRHQVGLPYQGWMVDQGFCFHGGEWNFPDKPRGNLYAREIVYQQVQGIESFEPWLAKLESEIDIKTLLGIAETIPPEWYEFDSESFHRLLEQLDSRRDKVRTLVWSARNSCPKYFPNWIDAPGELAKVGGRLCVR